MIADKSYKPMRVSCPNCATTFDAKAPPKPRSVEEHRRFFGIIRAAFRNWPESHLFQPKDEHHLRAWLICEAGPLYTEIETITLPDAPPALIATMMAFIERLLDADPRFKRGVWRGSTLTITRPKSLRFDKMKQGDFHELNERVSETVSRILQVTIKELLGEADEQAD